MHILKSRGTALVACRSDPGPGRWRGAVAGSNITSADIKDKAIKKADLAKNAVGSAKVKNG